MFKSSINKSVSTRNKAMKKSFFTSLRYKRILLARTKSVHGNLKDQKIMEMKESCSKPSELTPGSLRDTVYCHTVQFSDICAKTSDCTALVQVQEKGPDELFLNEASRLAYLNFSKFRVKDDINVAIKSISRFDTIMTIMMTRMKWATETDMQTTINVDSTQSSSPTSKEIERHPNIKWDKVPAQSRRRIQ